MNREMDIELGEFALIIGWAFLLIGFGVMLVIAPIISLATQSFPMPIEEWVWTGLVLTFIGTVFCVIGREAAYKF